MRMTLGAGDGVLHGLGIAGASGYKPNEAHMTWFMM